MGNRVSIAQEERDEAEFQSLVNAVTFARQSEGIYDLESGRHANGVEDSLERSNRPYYEANDRRTYDSYTQYSSAGNSFRHVSRRSQRPVHTPVPVIPPTAPAVVPGYMIPVSCSPITIVPPTQSNIVLPQTRPHSLSTIAESTSQPHAGIALPDSLHLPIAVEAPVPFRPIATDISEDDDWDAVSPVPSLASSRPPSAPPGPPQTVIVVPSQGSPISDHNEKDSAGSISSLSDGVSHRGRHNQDEGTIHIPNQTPAVHVPSHRSHSRGRSRSPILIESSRPIVPPNMINLPNSRSHSRRSFSPATSPRSARSRSSYRVASPQQPIPIRILESPVQTIPIVISRTWTRSRTRSPVVIGVRRSRSRSPTARRVHPTGSRSPSRRRITRSPSSRNFRRSISPRRRYPSRSRSPSIRRAIGRRLSRSPPIIEVLCRLSRSPPRRQYSQSPCRAHRISRSPTRRQHSRSPRQFSRSPRRRQYSRSPCRIYRVSRSPTRRQHSRSPCRSMDRLSRSSPRRHRTIRDSLSLIRTRTERSRSPTQEPLMQSNPHFPGFDKLCQVVESLERTTREFIIAQREHEEQRREYEERLFAPNRWQDRVPVHSRPYTPPIVTHDRTSEVFAEKKEIHMRGIDIRAYPNIPFAAGLALGIQSLPRSGWQPVWQVFPLKAFRGSNYTFLKIESHWDDADLLRELSRTYDRLRTWRKWFSLRNVSGMTMVLADHSFVYPQRVGPARVSPAKNMRLRYLLQNPLAMRHRYEFMQVLTSRTDLGIEFVERFQLERIACAILLPVIFSTLFGVLWAVFTGDVSSAFTVSGYMTSAYSVCLVLVGVINLVEY